MGIWWERCMFHFLRKKKQSNQKLQGRKTLYKKTIESIWTWNSAWFCTKKGKISLIFTNGTSLVDLYEVRGGTGGTGTLEKEMWSQHTVGKCRKQGEGASSMIKTCLHSSVTLAAFPSSVSWVYSWLPPQLQGAAWINRASCFLFLIKGWDREGGFPQSMSFVLTEPSLNQSSRPGCHVLIGFHMDCVMKTKVIWVREILPKPQAAVPWGRSRMSLGEANTTCHRPYYFHSFLKLGEEICLFFQSTFRV